MSFLSIAFLFALPLAAAPLLLHLFDRRRNAVIQWGAMQFLMEAAAKKTSARRLKQWLLLAMRVLAIVALIFALARPLLPAGYLGGEFRGETILVLDNSMSMLRTGNDETLMQDAIQESLSRLDRLPPRDDVRILTSAPYPVWGDVGRVRSDQTARQWLKDYLGELDATRGRSDLLAALFEAVQAEHAPNQSSRRIVVLTDGQAADWRLDDETGWNRFHQVLNSATVSTEIEIVRLDELSDEPAKGNLSVDDLSISRGVVGVNQLVTVTARLNNRGDSPLSPGELVWFVDGQEFHRQIVDPIDGGQNLDVPWEFSFDETGTYQFRCELESEDDLTADNRSSLVVEVVNEVPIVIVEDSFELAEMQQDAYFVQAALGWIDGEALDDQSIYVPTLITSTELSSVDLSSQRVVVIPNLTRLEEDAVERLSQFVSEGGGLWIALGPRTDVDSFNHQLFADAAGLSPMRIDRVVDTGAVNLGDAFDSLATGEDDDAVVDESMTGETTPEQREIRVDPFRGDHPATRQMTDDKQLDLADALIRRRFQFATSGPDELAVSTLLHLNNGQPLAVENFFGKGRVVVQAVPLRLQWSDLARTQSFVVMVRDWIDYLAQPRATQYNLQPGQSIELAVQDDLFGDDPSEGAPTGFLSTPQGDVIELTAERGSDAYVFHSSRTRLPGDYQLELGLADAKIPFHVQRDVGESDLREIDSAAEEQLLGWTTPRIDPEQHAEVASTQSDPVWPYLLIGLILLITGELVLSGVLSRERFGSAGIPSFSELDAPSSASGVSMPATSMPSGASQVPIDSVAPLSAERTR